MYIVLVENYFEVKRCVGDERGKEEEDGGGGVVEGLERCDLGGDV